jgi:hypothetical protein
VTQIVFTDHAYVAGENRVLGRALIEHACDILRVDPFVAGIRRCQFVEAVARLR